MVDGHSELWAVALDRYGMTFRCAACQSLWRRTSAPGDGYTWAVLAGNGAASSLPPRSTPLPAFSWRATGDIKPLAGDPQ